MSWIIRKSFAPCSRENHTSISSLSFFTGRMLFPTNSVKALKAIRDSTKNLEILLVGMSTNESIEISRIQETKPVVNA